MNWSSPILLAFPLVHGARPLIGMMVSPESQVHLVLLSGERREREREEKEGERREGGRERERIHL